MFKETELLKQFLTIIINIFKLTIKFSDFKKHNSSSNDLQWWNIYPEQQEFLPSHWRELGMIETTARNIL